MVDTLGSTLDDNAGDKCIEGFDGSTVTLGMASRKRPPCKV
jgi:hypothetical protein